MDDNTRELWKAIVRMAVEQARDITDDQKALTVKSLYKQWEIQIGKSLNVGEYIQYGDKLYRVLQAHTVQEAWKPGEGTESLYVVIDKEHSGTIDDPIPWTTNMECFNGKIYSYEGILYLCIRNSEIALQCVPTDVLNNYFIIYNDEIEIPNEDNNETEIPNENNNNNNNETEIPNEEENDDETSSEEVAEEGAMSNPIPYTIGTVVFKDKYYTENDIIYLCIRDSGAALYHPISSLLGNYFEKVE